MKTDVSEKLRTRDEGRGTRECGVQRSLPGGDKAPRILIVNVNWLGDVLFSTPFIRAVRQAYPESFIACMVPPRCREMLDGNPHINEIIAFDERGIHASIFAKLKFLGQLKQKRFQIAFLLHRSFTRTLLAYAAGTKERIGYATGKRRRLLTRAIESPAEQMHKVDYFLHIARSAGIAHCTREYDFYVGEDDAAYVTTLLGQAGLEDRFVVMNPGGNWEPKRWPHDRYAELAGSLAGEFGVPVVISGAEKDRKLAEEIIALVPGKSNVVSMCGKTSLKQLGALYKRAALVVANDTGPMHIAVAVEAPTIALFGPTSPQITGPCGKGSYAVIWKTEGCTVPCYDLACTDNRCMREITVDDVMVEARKLIK